MRTKLTPTLISAWRGLLTIHTKVVSKVEARLAEAGLPTLTWYDVLIVLYEAPEHRLRMSDLAEGVLLSRSGLTRLVDRLESEGHLRREACATDKRGWHVTLTEKGLALLRTVWPVYGAALQEEFFSRLAPGDAETLNGIWSRFNGPPGS